MRKRKLFVASLCAASLTAVALAGSDISIRLAEASNSGRGSPAGMNDVSGIIKESLGFDSCTFVASAWIRLPADRQTRALADYSVVCSGPQNRLSISVQRGGKSLLKTNVALQDGKPLILGGFPSGSGKHVFIFLVR